MPGRETPSDKFKRIAKNRTKRVLREIELLGNCSNRNHYRYTDDEVKKIFDAVEMQIKEARNRFIFKRSRNFDF